MQIPSKLQAGLSDHIASEILAENSYEQAAMLFDAMNWIGFAAWARKEAKHERKHARKFIDFLDDRNQPGVIGSIPAPMVKGKAPLDIFKQLLQLEQKVTGEIDALYKQATLPGGGDAGTEEFLDWFVDEQIESEKDLTIIIGQVERADNATLTFLDKRLRKHGK